MAKWRDGEMASNQLIITNYDNKGKESREYRDFFLEIIKAIGF
jgi:hypothetical protein